MKLKTVFLFFSIIFSLSVFSQPVDLNIDPKWDAFYKKGMVAIVIKPS